jgi:CheY-like chemotaxis protein
VKLAAAGKGIALDVVCDPASLRMIGDPVRLQQVAWNLIGNAIKFTPAGGRVEVRVDLVDSNARLRVRDTGQGFAPEMLPRMFDPFWQADSGPKRAHGGLGLGLAITKHLVEGHGGRIEAASEGPGRGATFTVVLPVVAVVPGEIETAAAAAPAVSATEAAAGAELRLDGIRVLVVDDDPFSLEVITAILRERGAEVHAAQSGMQALRLLGSTTVDVMVSDIAMPGMDGYELIQRARTFVQQNQRTVASVALTAYAAPQDVTRALVSGFQRHLAKPVSPVCLVDTVLDVTRSSR